MHKRDREFKKAFALGFKWPGILRDHIGEFARGREGVHLRGKPGAVEILNRLRGEGQILRILRALTGRSAPAGCG